MSERMTVYCDCERGGNCTKTTMCATDSALADQADEYETQIEKLETKLKAQRKGVLECGRHRHNLTDMPEKHNGEWLFRDDVIAALGKTNV
jgi:hypothetical protein